MQRDTREPTTTSPFDQAMSAADRAMLAPVLARQYLSAEPVTLSGVMTRIWRRHRWLSPAFQLLAPMRMLFAETGQDVPTTLRITPELDKHGRPVQHWERTFSFPGADRHIDGLVTWDERLGQVVERIGPGGVLDYPFRLHAHPGGLRIEATGLRLRVAGRVVRFPRLLGASVLVDQVADPDDVDTLRISLTISHALLGALFGYEGTLRLSGAVTSRDREEPAPAVLDRLLDLAPKHPVGMSTDYRTVALLNYAVDPDVLRRLIPPPLELDVVHDGSSDFPAGSAVLDNTFVARGVPYRWYAAEYERSPSDWQRPRISLPD